MFTGVALAAGAGGASAQESAFVFERYGVEEGLSNRFAVSLAQDRIGFLWVGTQGGLNRFDGHSFRTYTSRPGDSTTLSNSYVYCLLVASDSVLWVGTDGGLNRYVGNGEFARYDVGDDHDSNVVRAIAEGGNGHLLLGTDGGAFTLDPVTGESSLIAGTDEGAAGSGSYAAASLPDGSVLVGHENGTLRHLELAEPGDGRWAEMGSLTFDSPVRALHAVTGDTVLVGTRSGHVYAITLDGAIEIAESLVDVGPLSPVQHVYRDSPGTIWISTEDDGLIELAPDGRLSVHRPDPTDPTSLPDMEVRQVLEDRSGVLWVASWGGVAALSPYRSAIHRYPGADRGRGVLSAGGVVPIEPGPNGALWLGLMDGPVDVFERGGGVLRTYRPDRSHPDSAGADVFDLAAVSDGSVWAALVGGGLARLDALDGSTEPFTPLTSDPDRVALQFGAVHEDGRGDVWAGSLEDGLYRFNHATRLFQQYHGPDSTWDYGAPYIRPIVEDSLGQLWFGAAGATGGIHRLSADRTEIWSLTFDPEIPIGLSHGRVLTLYPHPDGHVWVGTEGGGLNRVYPRDPPRTSDVRVYRVEDGLPHDHVNGIVEDDNGYLWISTDAGIARFDPEQEAFWSFRTRSGLQDNQFYAHSAYKGPDGMLYFGGPGGLNVIDPSAIEPRDAPPTVAVTRFQIHGVDQPIGPWALGEGELVLRPGQNFFAFEFAALDFTDPSLNRYRYRLVGLPGDSIESGNDTRANYTTVPPDRYTFVVGAANSEGVWNDSALQIPVRVMPRYYQTWLFQASLVLVAALSVWALYAYRLSQINARQALRLRFAGRLHDDIGANLATMALKSEMVRGAAELGERQQQHLADLSRLAREATHKVRETVWVVNTEYDSVAGILTKMRETAHTMLGGHVEVDFTSPSELPKVPVGMELRQDVYLLFKEALQNIVKHAEATRVTIDFAFEKPILTLIVHDDGRGFDPSDPRVGNGLVLMRRRAERHGGTCEVVSTPGGGTTVTARVPIR